MTMGFPWPSAAVHAISMSSMDTVSIRRIGLTSLTEKFDGARRPPASPIEAEGGGHTSPNGKNSRFQGETNSLGRINGPPVLGYVRGGCEGSPAARRTLRPCPGGALKLNRPWAPAPRRFGPVRTLRPGALHIREPPVPHRLEGSPAGHFFHGSASP